MSIVVRRLERIEEFHDAVKVQLSAWGMEPGDCSNLTPPHILIAASRNGGIVLGAFDERTGEMIGFSYAFVGRDERGFYLYSHQTGVVEGRKHEGVGYALKLEQRKMALELGYELIKWTFDPAQSVNSRFNIGKLGVVVRKFVENYYGSLNDRINRGMPTDRFVAEWWIKSRRVELKILGELSSPSLESLRRIGAQEVIKVVDGRPIEVDLDASSDVVLVRIPVDISSLRDADEELAIRWRLMIRKALDYYINQKGYLAVEFSTDRRNYSYHVLWRTSLDRVLNVEGYPWREP